MSIRRDSSAGRRRGIDTAYLLVLPALLGCLVFTVYPVCYNFYLSALKWDFLSNTKKFVGLSNYAKLLASGDFLHVLGNSTFYMAVVVAVSISAALFLAVLLRRNTKINLFAQSAIFTPYIISLVSISILWMWILDPDYGLLNYVLGWFGIPHIRWLESPSTALVALMIVGVWKTVGYNTLILLAGMQSISPSIYESARLDRSSRATTFFRITVPLLSPSLFFLLIVNITSSFEVFDSVKVMTQGGPLNSTNLLVHWIYQTGFEYYRIGEAATGSVFLFVIVAFATFLNFKSFGDKVHYQ